MWYARSVLVAAALLLVPLADAGHGEDLAGESEVLLNDLELPADIDIAPDGAIWFIEVRSGEVQRFDPATGVVEVMHSTDIMTGGERGLVGLALAGDFAQTQAFYIYYTAPDEGNGTNRLVRVENGQEQLLTTVPGAEEHNGGRIVVTVEGDLFVGTGENQLRDPAQDPDSLLGKILHLTPGGDPVEGNLQGLVHSMGHRNVYGLAIDPDSGALWASENSGWRRDEINRIEAGGNYGYPECEGRGLNGVDDPCPEDKGYIFPVKSFYEDRAAAPTGMTFWQGGLYWASLNEGSIHHLWQENGTWQDEVVHEHGEPLLDLAVGPDGRFYYSSMSGIHAFAAPGSDDAEPPVRGVPWAIWSVFGVLALAATRR